MGVGIVQAKGQPFDVSGRTIGFELLKVGAAVPNFTSGGSAVEFSPGRGSGERVVKFLQANFPVAVFEIEVVLAVAPRGGLLRVGEACSEQAANTITLKKNTDRRNTFMISLHAFVLNR